MLNNFKINVAVYDRTAALAASPTYAKWAADNGGPIQSMHIVNVLFDSTEHKVHECLKSAVKAMGEPYYYQLGWATGGQGRRGRTFGKGSRIGGCRGAEPPALGPRSGKFWQIEGLGSHFLVKNDLCSPDRPAPNFDHFLLLR